MFPDASAGVCSRRGTSRPLPRRGRPEDLARHEVAVDLAGPLDDARDPQRAEPVLQRQLLCHTHTTEDLHHRVDDAEPHLRAIELRDRRGGPSILTTVMRVGSLPGQVAGRADPCPTGSGVGPRVDHAVSRIVGTTGPHLASVEHVVIALAYRHGADRPSRIRATSWLADRGEGGPGLLDRRHDVALDLVSTAV